MAKDVIFALTFTGVCSAFQRDNFKRICYMNSSSDEVIRSLFFNKLNQSLIHVAVHKTDKYGSLRCRTTPLEYIKQGKPQVGVPLFENETLSWPGFVEFDDVNGKVLTYVAKERVYKIWDLRTYQYLYTVADPKLEEIKISPGLMLLIMQREQGHLPLRVLDIHTGSVMVSLKHLLHRNKKVDFIEQFNDKLLIKQENECLQIVDVRSREILQIDKTKFLTPSAFIFLHEKQLFLTFRGREVLAWNFKGEQVTTFEDHPLLTSPDTQLATNTNLFITTGQDVLISYCHNKQTEQEDAENGCSINMSSILTGKSLGKIGASTGPVNAVESEKRAALRDITALHFNEERNEIITGNRNGMLSIWAP